MNKIFLLTTLFTSLIILSTASAAQSVKTLYTCEQTDQLNQPDAQTITLTQELDNSLLLTVGKRNLDAAELTATVAYHDKAVCPVPCEIYDNKNFGIMFVVGFVPNQPIFGRFTVDQKSRNFTCQKVD